MSSSEAGTRAMRALLQRPRTSLVGVDFDGTLAPIIDDPENAYAHPGAIAALGRLGSVVGSVVVITGRPARTAVRLGRFEGVPGLESMIVLGQYGVERWDAETGEFSLPPEPVEITRVAEELPELLSTLGLEDVRIEHKGRAVGIHTRELSDAAGALERLREPITALAARHDLHVEPGKNVLEIRAPGFDKGDALLEVVAERGADVVIFAGDDLGDLPAFQAVAELRETGLDGLLVCSASHEEDALADLADLVLDGPPGVAAWLTRLADTLGAPA